MIAKQGFALITYCAKTNFSLCKILAYVSKHCPKLKAISAVAEMANQTNPPAPNLVVGEGYYQ
jgi:hypothetical protein